MLLQEKIDISCLNKPVAFEFFENKRLYFRIWMLTPSRENECDEQTTRKNN
jgi:hypothetical protein